MKGLNCSASFCVASCTKKSRTPPQAEDGFFVPGDTVDVQRDLFFLNAVAGSGFLLRLWPSVAGPATVYLSSSIEMT